jgi:hypothetical protein
MNASPIPPGTLSTTTIAGTLLAAALGAFQGHPGWLCLALALCVVLALGRAAIEVWKGKGAPAGPPAAALLLLFLLPACVTARGHYETTPPDPRACGAALLRAAAVQAPCDVRPAPPVPQLLACILGAAAEAMPCAPTSVWVPDPPAAPAAAGK